MGDRRIKMALRFIRRPEWKYSMRVIDDRYVSVTVYNGFGSKVVMYNHENIPKWMWECKAMLDVAKDSKVMFTEIPEFGSVNGDVYTFYPQR
jgi:hypothetical protein